MEYLKKVLQLFCIFQLTEAQARSKKMIIVKPRSQNIRREGSKEKIMDINQAERNYLAEIPHQLGVPAPQIQSQASKKVLLLDLDRTIIYFNEKVGLFVRPYLNQFLNELKPLFTIYIFTAATVTYACKVLELAKQEAPSLNGVAGVLTRDNCIRVNMSSRKPFFIKDLKNVLIVDDCPVSYCLNKQNAVPIAPFSGYEGDSHLQNTLLILKQAHQYQDVRNYVQNKYLGKKIKSKQNRIFSDKTNL